MTAKKQYKTDHGIRKVRHGKDRAINLPAAVKTSEYYHIYELANGKIELVPVVL